MKVGDTVVRDSRFNPIWDDYCKKHNIAVDDTLTITSRDFSNNGVSFHGDTIYWGAEYFHEAPETVDCVTKPSHYQFFPELEAIEVIASALTLAEFRGYCIGNRLKYRLRAGNKDKLEQDIAKSDYYIKLYEQHKHLCKDK